jgi:SAM-dependent methyltransferase
MDREYDACPLCGGRAREVRYRLPIGDVVECPRCALVSLVDPVSRLLVTCSYDAAYYRRPEGGGVGYEDYFGTESELRDAFARTLAAGLSRGFAALRTTLDVGCGGGYLVRALADLGIDSYGVDTSPYVVAHGLPGTGGRLIEGDLSAAPVSIHRPYDLVTVMDAIEHLTDPVGVVRQAFSLLRPGGSLVVLTPRYGGRLLAEQGEQYVHFNTDHTYYFSAKTLHSTVRKATGVEPEIADVLDVLATWEAPVPDDIRRKYTEERDSIIAVATRTS